MTTINIQAENQVLAGMMNNHNFLYDAMAESHKEMFTTQENKDLFDELIKRSDKPIKASMLIQEFQDRKKSHIKVIDNEWIDVEHSKNALHNLKETFIKRQLSYTIEETKKQMDAKTSDELIADIEQEIGKFYFDDKNENIIEAKEYGKEFRQEFYDLLIDPDQAKGIPYSITNSDGSYKGFPSLDKTFNGAQGGDLIMLAAKTGHGKTAFAITLSRLFSLYQDYAGFYENAEMRKRELVSRLLAPIANVDSNEIFYAKLEGSIAEQELKRNRIDNAINDFENSNLFISRIPSLPLHKAKGLAKQVRNRYKKLDYLVVDYIGRMTIEGKKNMQTWDEMYEITKQLKELAMTLNIPVFMLAQLNDEGNVEGAKKMKNECDGVLYFQPIEDKDDRLLDEYSETKRQAINYKIVKEKVRRDDNPLPIYVNFYKKQQIITEVMR